MMHYFWYIAKTEMLRVDMVGSRNLILGAALVLVPAVVALAGATMLQFPPGYDVSESIAAGASDVGQENEPEASSTTATTEAGNTSTTDEATASEEPTSAEPISTEPLEEATYQVQAGDSLSEIGNRFGTDWREIAVLNNITNPNLIFEGQVLRLTAVRSGEPLTIGNDQFDDTIFVVVAGRSSLSPDLLRAVAWVSSEWDPQLIGSGGKLGIGQLRPETYGFIERDLLGRSVDSTDPASSTEAMGAYLAWLVEHTEGEVAPALAAYFEGLVTVRNIGWGPSTVEFVDAVVATQEEFATAS